MSGGESRSDWRTVRFGDVVRNVDEAVRDPLTCDLERLVGLEHIDPESLRIKRWGLIADGTSFTRKFTAGQVLFGKRRAYQRKVAVADFDGLCSSDILVFEPADDQLLPELLPFIVQTEGFFQHALGTSAGSLSPRTRWRDLAAYEFSLPPLDEQRRIAEILWAAEAAIEGWKAARVGLCQYRDALMYNLFADGNKVEQIPCSELCDEITVGIVVTPAKYYASQGAPALRSLDVLPDRFALADLVYLSGQGHQQHAKSQLCAGDVVIVRSGRPGDAAVIPPEMAGFNCIDLIIVRPGNNLRSGYLSRFLNSTEGRKQLERGTAGTAQRHFNVSAMKKLTVPLLPLEGQDQIVGNLESVEKALSDLDEHIRRTSAFKVELGRNFLGS